MPERERDAPHTTPDEAGDSTEKPSRSRTRRGRPAPRTAAQWREALREEELPEQLAELPYLQRRRARRAWRSARRDERTQWVKDERRNVPTPVTVPVIALVVAGLVAGAAWLWPDKDHDTVRPKSAHTAPASPETSSSLAPAPTPTPSSTAPHPGTADGVAKAFITAYTRRMPLQDGSHTAAVQRAAPYASAPLVTNLTKHDDLDWNKLVAAQAVSAKPSKVTIGRPQAKDRPAPDTSVRVYRQATADIEVKGTDAYRYTRHLTVEVSRADVGNPWMVTRVLGVEE